MPSYHPISRTRHATLFWSRHRNYAHAKQAQIAPLVWAEVAKAAVEYPIGFIVKNQSAELVCLLGIESEKCLFVGQNNAWQGQYIPAAFRSFPFALCPDEQGKPVLCIDEHSGLTSPETGDERFFTPEGSVSPALQSILDFLSTINASKTATQTMTQALLNHGVLTPWPITLETSNGKKQLEGLHRIDEAALNAISHDALLQLHSTKALALAYYQLLSQQHLPKLATLYELHQKTTAKPTQIAHQLNDDEGISFDEFY